MADSQPVQACATKSFKQHRIQASRVNMPEKGPGSLSSELQNEMPRDCVTVHSQFRAPCLTAHLRSVCAAWLHAPRSKSHGNVTKKSRCHSRVRELLHVNAYLHPFLLLNCVAIDVSYKAPQEALNVQYIGYFVSVRTHDSHPHPTEQCCIILELTNCSIVMQSTIV